MILQSTHHSCGFLHHCVLHVVNGVALFRKLLRCKSALVVSVCAQTSVHTAHSCRRWAVEWRSVKSHLSAPQLSAPQLSGPADCCYLSSDKPQWAMCLPPCTWLGWQCLQGFLCTHPLSSIGWERGSISGWESEWECWWRVVGWEGGVRRVRVGGKCWGLACFADHPDHLSNVHMSVSPFLLCSTRSPLTALVLPASPPLQMAPYLTRCRPCAWRSRP